MAFVYLHGLNLHNVLLLQTLLDDVKGDTHGHFEDILVALITPPAAYDCHEVMRAMKVLLAILLDSSRNNMVDEPSQL